MRWPFGRKKAGGKTGDKATHSQKIWFAKATKDPFGVKVRETRRREFVPRMAPTDDIGDDEGEFF